MKSTRLLAATLGWFVLLVTGAARAADLANCTGVVVDENGVPLVAAQVALAASTGHVYHSETDGAGRFTIKNLPAGDYKVEVRKEGFFLLSNYAATLQPGANEFKLTL